MQCGDVAVTGQQTSLRRASVDRLAGFLGPERVGTPWRATAPVSRLGRSCDSRAIGRDSSGGPHLSVPDPRVDPQLSSYVQSIGFRRHTAETRRNYATDLRLFLTFLWGRKVNWQDATRKDVEDYEDWRRFAHHNPRPIGGVKWDRELSALAGFYTWAAENQHVRSSPFAMKRIVGRDGTTITVPAARAKDARRSNVHWLTPRSWRRWIDIGLRGHTRGGMSEPGWVGRLEERNVAYVRLMLTSGLRRAEGGSLLTLEVPTRGLDTGRYCRGRIAAEVTRSKKPRTFYVAADAVGEVETYCVSSRALAVRQAQKSRRYERLPDRRLVTAIAGGFNPGRYVVRPNRRQGPT